MTTTTPTTFLDLTEDLNEERITAVVRIINLISDEVDTAIEIWNTCKANAERIATSVRNAKDAELAANVYFYDFDYSEYEGRRYREGRITDSTETHKMDTSDWTRFQIGVGERLREMGFYLNTPTDRRFMTDAKYNERRAFIELVSMFVTIWNSVDEVEMSEEQITDMITENWRTAEKFLDAMINAFRSSES